MPLHKWIALLFPESILVAFEFTLPCLSADRDSDQGDSSEFKVSEKKVIGEHLARPGGRSKFQR